MTGEMWTITQDGVDQDGETWDIHAAVARSVGGTLQPFDVYQGPYILVGKDRRVGERPYRVTLPGPCRLWITADENDTGTVYREDTGASACWWPYSSESRAIEAARSLLEGVGVSAAVAAAESVL